jgi:hypothetical protein
MCGVSKYYVHKISSQSYFVVCASFSALEMYTKILNIFVHKIEKC